MGSWHDPNPVFKGSLKNNKKIIDRYLFTVRLYNHSIVLDIILYSAWDFANDKNPIYLEKRRIFRKICQKGTTFGTLKNTVRDTVYTFYDFYKTSGKTFNLINIFSFAFLA